MLEKDGTNGQTRETGGDARQLLYAYHYGRGQCN